MKPTISNRVIFLVTALALIPLGACKIGPIVPASLCVTPVDGIPDTAKLVTVSGTGIKIYQTEDGSLYFWYNSKLLKPAFYYSPRSCTITFSPDSRLLVINDYPYARGCEVHLIEIISQQRNFCFKEIWNSIDKSGVVTPKILASWEFQNFCENGEKLHMKVTNDVYGVRPRPSEDIVIDARSGKFVTNDGE
jgi:hypothetical protein